MSVAGKLSGKASSIVVDGTTLNVTKYTVKHTRTTVETVDTGSYDAGTDMLHQEQVPVKLGTEIDIEGYFYTTNTNTALIAKLYAGTAAVPCTCNLNATPVVYGHGNFDFGDFECEVPVGDKVNFKANLKSNGVFTPGS